MPVHKIRERIHASEDTHLDRNHPISKSEDGVGALPVPWTNNVNVANLFICRLVDDFHVR